MSDKVQSASTYIPAALERISGIILQFNWSMHWKYVIGIIVGLWLAKQLVYRERLLAETRGMMFTLPAFLAGGAMFTCILGLASVIKWSGIVNQMGWFK